MSSTSSPSRYGATAIALLTVSVLYLALAAVVLAVQVLIIALLAWNIGKRRKEAVARQQAVEAGCAEAIMLRDGCLTEGAASNIFAVKNGVILTPPQDGRILPGITYDVVLELAARHGAALEVRPVAEAELRTADELWMTSSTKEVLAIVRLDGSSVGTGEFAGRPGPVTRRMHDWYRTFRDEVMRHADA